MFQIQQIICELTDILDKVYREMPCSQRGAEHVLLRVDVSFYTSLILRPLAERLTHKMEKTQTILKNILEIISQLNQSSINT